jgi:hypothetical protein
MTHEELEREFASHGRRWGDVLLLLPPDALALVQRARSERVPILGIDGFHLGPAAMVPDLAHSIDFSGASCRTNPWSEAEAFLEERAGSGMYFEVVLGAPPAIG